MESVPRKEVIGLVPMLPRCTLSSRGRRPSSTTPLEVGGKTDPLRDSSTGPTAVSGGPLRGSVIGPTTVGGGLPPSLQAPVCCIDVIMGEKRARRCHRSELIRS